MDSRRLRETLRHKLRLRSCYLSAEIRASLRFVCLRTDDAMLNDAHLNYIYVALHTQYVSKKGIVFQTSRMSVKTQKKTIAQNAIAVRDVIATDPVSRSTV